MLLPNKSIQRTRKLAADLIVSVEAANELNSIGEIAYEMAKIDCVRSDCGGL
jgi:hypothetical protein